MESVKFPTGIDCVLCEYAWEFRERPHRFLVAIGDDERETPGYFRAFLSELVGR